MSINPNALVFWAIGAVIGWLVNGTHGAAVGLVVALSVSLLAAFLPSGRR